MSEDRRRLPSNDDKRGGYSGGTSADNVKPPSQVPSGSINAPTVKPNGNGNSK
jgi:hypothetical protein